MLKIGDWVTQYSKGYWQIIDIKPKYAEEDYQYENGFFQKKRRCNRLLGFDDKRIYALYEVYGGFRCL